LAAVLIGGDRGADGVDDAPVEDPTPGAVEQAGHRPKSLATPRLDALLESIWAIRLAAPAP
jgi:hypothetical protein